MSNPPASQAPFQIPRYIYKIAPAQPTPILSSSSPSSNDDDDAPILPASNLDISSAFIHMSTAAQIPGTLSRFFSTDERTENVVWLLKVPVINFITTSDGNAAEGEEEGEVLRWESPDGNAPGEDGEVFPHLYFDADAGTGADAERERRERRLWLRRREVLDVRKVVCGVGKVGWEDGLAELMVVVEGVGENLVGEGGAWLV